MKKSHLRLAVDIGGTFTYTPRSVNKLVVAGRFRDRSFRVEGSFRLIAQGANDPRVKQAESEQIVALFTAFEDWASLPGPATVAGREVLFEGVEDRDEVREKFEGMDPHQTIRRNFLHCVRTRELPFRDIAVAHRTATHCHLGNLAYWLKRPLRWDPVKEEIIGDPEASRWMDRSYREPWPLG